LFSIVLPTFNRPEMLGRAVASVFAQTFQDFELIVVDDGSGGALGRTPAPPRDERVCVVRHDVNRGAAAARNSGIRIARGRYVTFLDDDDEYLPTFLAATRDALAGAPPSVGLTWCGIRILQDNQGDGAPIAPPPGDAEGRPQSLVGRLLWAGTSCGVTLTAACLESVGGFDPSLQTVEDSDLFLRVLDGGFVPRFVSSAHVVVHHHSSPRLSDASRHPTRIQECRLLIARHAAYLRCYPALAAQLDAHVRYLEGELAGAANR